MHGLPSSHAAQQLHAAIGRNAAPTRSAGPGRPGNGQDDVRSELQAAVLCGVNADAALRVRRFGHGWVVRAGCAWVLRGRGGVA